MIIHVVRNFEDTNVHHVEGTIDPLRVVELIEIELAMADIGSVEKRLALVQGKMKAGKTKEMEYEETALKKIFEVLEQGKMANVVELTEDEDKTLKDFPMLTRKPILYVVNVDESAASDANWKSPLGPDRLALPLSIKVESEIMEMPPEEQKEFLEALGLKLSGLDRLIQKCYQLLELITFMTVGPKECRAWTVKKGTKAPQAAGVIHTDFEKAFIRAEIIPWQDFVDLGESGARDKGKLRVEGKDYVIQDGDTCHFRVGV
jgi:GTP-binding protein YchF